MQVKPNGDILYPGSLVRFYSGLGGIGVDWYPRSTDNRDSRDVGIFNGDLFLVLRGCFPIALTEFREMYCFRLNKNVWVNAVFADHFERIKNEP